MGKGWRILGSGYSKNKCLLTVQHSRGSEQIQTSLKRRTAGSPASSAGACGAERTAPCVRLDWELLRARRQRAGSWQLSARLLARSLARSRPLPPGNGLPHHLSSGTTCCFSCMATTTAWDKMVSRKWEGFWPLKKERKKLIGTVLLYKQSLSL